jgi:glycosyltransferase involved in cell wall biosynthesis
VATDRSVKPAPSRAPRVSVAMATFNGERFLSEQLESVARQTLLPTELVVSDDGSTDRTTAIVREFAARAPFPVKLLEGGPRLNYRLNFRRAAQHCSGDLIAFCDQDDVWQPEKLERMTQAFTETEVLLAYHNAIVSSAAGERMLHSADEERAALRTRPMAPFKSPNGLLMLFRSELRRFDNLWDMTIDQNEGDVMLAHDQWHFFLSRVLGAVRFIDEPLVLYRQHADNTLGVAVKASLRERVARRLIHFGTADLWAAKSAESRAKVLRIMQEQEGGERLGRVAKSYEQLARRRRRRAAIYCKDKASSRFAALIGCLVAGDYRGGAWAFKPASIVRDIWSGVIQGKCSDPTRVY